MLAGCMHGCILPLVYFHLGLISIWTLHGGIRRATALPQEVCCVHFTLVLKYFPVFLWPRKALEPTKAHSESRT